MKNQILSVKYQRLFPLGSKDLAKVKVFSLKCDAESLTRNL